MIAKTKNCSGGLIALVVSMLILHVAPARADILDSWHWRNPTPFSDTMHCVCFGAGTFVAVGENGLIHASTDGTTWDSGHRPVIFDLNEVIYADGKFVAVGNGGNIVTSTNGTDWDVQNSGTTNNLYVVGYGNGKFVANTLNESQLLISENGTDWTVMGTLGIGWITFGNGVFVGGAGLSGNVLVSSDGLTWTGAELPYPSPYGHIALAGAFGNGTFVVVVEGETNSQPASFFYSSVDGTNWFQKSFLTLGPGTKTNYTTITNSDGGVVIISEAITDAHRYFGFLNGAFHEVADWVDEHGFVNISVTSDGTSYITRYAPTNASSAQSMAYGNGKYVLIGGSGRTWVSTDETNWVATYCGSREGLFQIAQGNGRLVAAGDTMLVSSDGMTFTNGATQPTNSMSAIAFDGTNFVAVGGKVSGFSGIGYVATSTNGSDWMDRTNISGGILSAVCHAAPGWVAVGGGGVFTSQDTLTWTRRSFLRPNVVTYGNGIYVAVGNSGAVFTSPDGVTWTVQSSGTTKHLFGIAFQNGQFTAVGDKGAIITSPDGVNWTAQISGTTQPLLSIACGAGSYLVRGVNTIPSNILVPQSPEFFLFSTDGTNWSDVSTRIPTTTIVRSIAYANQSFWIVGDNGMLLQSDVADASPHLAAPVMSENGGLKLSVTLNSAASYRVQFRTNFLDSWRDVYTNSSPITSDSWTDTNASQRASGYYRIVSP